MDSRIGLIIQFSGVFSITALMFLLTQSLKSATLSYWKKSWLMLFISLFSLHFVFNLTNVPRIFSFLYYLGEYIFLYFLIAGCYKYSTDNDFPRKSWFFLIPASLMSFFLTTLMIDFDSVFNLHAFVMGTGFAVAFLLIKPRNPGELNLGVKIVRFSLFVLALDFYHYTFLFSFTKEYFANYLSYNPVIDLFFEISLGFGMIIVLLEKVRHQVEESNERLKEAHTKLEELAQTDALTTAFNRHAFYGYLKKQGGAMNDNSGCVGFFDIDNLKPINDQLGHNVGDGVIREVTMAIRSLIRAEDLIFRWGGDEFFVVMISMNSEMARERMRELPEILKDVQVHGAKERLSIAVSCGFADFADISEIEQAIKSADDEMYQVKQERKKNPNVLSFPSKSQKKPLLSA